MDNKEINSLVRNATDYNELKNFIDAANKEIKYRQEQVREDCKKKIQDAISAARAVGFQVVFKCCDAEWKYEERDRIELR